MNEKIGELNQKLNMKIHEFMDEIKNIDRNKNYDYVKCYQLTDKLKWYLIQKEEKNSKRRKKSGNS